MKVEKACTADIDTLVKLRVAYLTEDNGAIDAHDEETVRRDLPGYYQAHLGKDLHVYVIRESQSIVSCAFLLVVEKPLSPAFLTGRTGLVLNVYTQPEYRRRGYAKRLMEAMLEDARELNLSVVELQATDDGYTLYLSVGFEDDASKYHRMKWFNR